MDVAQLIPHPGVLPAPWGLFNALLVVAFTLHLLAANILLGAGRKHMPTFAGNRQEREAPGIHVFQGLRKGL